MADELVLVYSLSYNPATSLLLKESWEDEHREDQLAFVRAFSQTYGSESGMNWYVVMGFT